MSRINNVESNKKKTDKAVGFGETFRIPLSDRELIYLGKVITLFSAIERQLDNIGDRLSGTNNMIVWEMLTGDLRFGSKVKIVKDIAILNLRHDQPQSDIIADLCDDLLKVVSVRDQAVHGKWGLLFDKTKTKGLPLVPADAEQSQRYVEDFDRIAYSDKRPDRPLHATELKKLVNRIEKIARSTFIAHMRLQGSSNNPIFPIVDIFNPKRSMLTDLKLSRRNRANDRGGTQKTKKRQSKPKQEQY